MLSTPFSTLGPTLNRPFGVAALVVIIAALLCSGCHLIFPFDVVSNDDAALPRGDGSHHDAALAGDGLSPGDQRLEQNLDQAEPDGVLPADAIPQDATPSSDSPLSPDSTLAADATVPPYTTGVLWAQRFGNTMLDQGNDVVTDSSGNIYVAGSFDGAVDFGDGQPISSNGYLDIFVASYTADGAFRWAYGHGGTGSETVTSLAVDPTGNLTVTGGFTSPSVDFGGGALPHSGGIADDLYVASFDSLGGYRWARAHGDSGGNDRGRGITADAAGNVTLAGFFVGSVDFGCGNLTAGNTASDILLVSYDNNGVCRWSHDYGTTGGTDSAYAVASDASGNVYVTGSFQNSVDFGGGALGAVGSSDIFLASYTSDGGYRWDKRFGGAGADHGMGVAVDSLDHVVLAARFVGAVDFGGGDLTAVGTADVALASYGASDGSYGWAQSFGGSGWETGVGEVGVRGNGDIYLIGQFGGTTDFGAVQRTSNGGHDAFVLSVSSAGALRWVMPFGGSDYEYGNGLAVSGSAIYVTGRFYSPTVAFGGTVLTNASGGGDIFLAALQP